MRIFKTLQINSLVTAILYVALGLLFVIVPEVVSRSLAVILGITLLLAGIVFIIDYFRTWDIEYRSNGLAIGILFVFGAMFMFFQSSLLEAIIPLLLGFAVVISGALKLQNAIVLSRAKVGFWIAALVLALVCLILGFLIMLDPFATLRVLITLIGVSLLISGITDLVILFVMSRKSDAISAVGRGGRA